MKGWTGRFLRINLTTKNVKIQNYPEDLARDYIGGRGFAIKILWDELKPGADPLGPQNLFIVAAGPLTGLQIPSAGKVVVAAKSPLTGGYGDGNTGTDVALQLRRAGYDAIVIEGSAKEPHYVYIEDDKTELITAADLWGLGSIETENTLKEKFGRRTGYLTIGQAGENKVRYAIVRSLHARAGGRPGMGAVMGSKKLKAIVVKGTGEIPVEDKEELKKHEDASYVVYYLIDEMDKQIYIGSAKRLGDRVKLNRPEIPGWTKFKYEILHPNYHQLLKRVEFHAIRAFASFFKNLGHVQAYPVSEYTLVNKNWPKRR